MAGSADAAKNALESLFNKTKEVVHTAAETTKGYANVAIGKIMPGQQNNAQPTDAGMSGASGATATTATGASDANVPTGGVQ